MNDRKDRRSDQRKERPLKEDRRDSGRRELNYPPSRKSEDSWVMNTDAPPDKPDKKK